MAPSVPRRPAYWEEEVMRKHSPASVDELGAPVAYTALYDGTPVYDPDMNRVGVVEQVMAVGGIFEGVVVHTYPLPGRHLYADAGQIAETRERGVVLSVPREELHDPANRRRRDDAENGLEARLRRAWDWITRNS
jgi:hypothetical protein